MKKSLYLGASSIIGLLVVQPAAHAQDTDGSEESLRNTIVVTSARKQEESLQDVPVTVTAFTGEEIDNMRIDSIDNLSALIPGFFAQDTVDTAPQGTISLRGIGTGATAIGADQAVSINVDGVQIENSLGMRAGQIDLAQIEVLKGPQALFFGKNATGGVIAIRTADPTPEFFARATAGYEFTANESFGELVVSGPVTDTLGVRAVGYFTSVDGWVRNNATGPVNDRSAPDYNEFIGRLTFVFDPSDNFDARAKISYAERDGNHSTIGEKVVCPDPNRDTSDCTLNFVQSNVEVSEGFPGREQYDDTSAFLASLEMNIGLSDNFNLTSVTGYYDIKEQSDGHPWPVELTAPSTVEITQTIQSISQELRLTSDFDGPFNFVVGGFYDNREQTHRNRDFFFGPLPIPQTFQTLDSESISVFGQVQFDITENLELSGGLRYSDETKSYSGNFIADYLVPSPDPMAPPGTFVPLVTAGQPIRLAIEEISFNNLSPEVTLTYQPNPDVTLFATYKQGYKSGSFDIGTGNAFSGFAPPGAPPGFANFRPESAEGGELGFKTFLFDGNVRLNGAIFSYEYSDLQLASIDNATGNIGTANASSARVKGFEADLRWSPEGIDGLTFMGAISYLSAKYTEEYLTQCNSPQLIGGTCPFDLNPAPTAPGNDFQDLNGEDLINAPEWSGTAGFVFDQPDALADGAAGLRFGLNLVYSGSYQGNTVNDPRGIQDSYFLLNGNLGVYHDDSGFEVELIGRNLTNNAVAIRVPEQPNAAPPGELTDLYGVAIRAREVVLQVTKTF